ncbi:hypothetical protein ISS21_00335 [Patescibacteria group bacterium]|nr:hypothetical protein [Patescibacteria group bacterium]
MKKYLPFICSGLLIALLLLPSVALGQDFGNGYLNEFGNVAGYGTAGLGEIIGKMIKAVLSLLALVAVVLIIVGGFQWMTSGGNQEKIEGAKKLMGSALIGLVIVVLAYAIAAFVINSLTGVTA